MTEQQIVQEFRSYPKAEQFEIIRQLTEIYEEDLKKHIRNGNKLSTEEEKTINRLREIVAGEVKTKLTENS